MYCFHSVVPELRSRNMLGYPVLSTIEVRIASQLLLNYVVAAQKIVQIRCWSLVKAARESCTTLSLTGK